MAEKKTGSLSGYFDIPDVSLFLEGNTFTGSENTFNFRIEPSGDNIKVFVWYGMKCFELSEPVTTHESGKSAEGLAELIKCIDDDYVKYLALVESGEVQSRRTYKPQKIVK